MFHHEMPWIVRYVILPLSKLASSNNFIDFMFGRPDHSYMEQYITQLHRYSNRSLALYHVGILPSEGRLGCFRVYGPDGASLGHFRTTEKHAQHRAWRI